MPLKFDFTPEERKEHGRKGALVRTEHIKQQKMMAATLQRFLDMPNDKQAGMTNREVMMASLIKQAMNGNVRAAIFVRDTCGEAPVNKSEVTQEKTVRMVVFDEQGKDISGEI